jgi:hypothetical protein
MGYALMPIQSAFEGAGTGFLDNDAGGRIGVRFSKQKKGPRSKASNFILVL